ncbi:MAG: malonyl-CoA decarboxylase family protein [Rhodospirillales bacterium]
MPLLSFWRDQVGSIADRGRELLAFGAPKRAVEPGDLARRLLSQRGEASGLALAQDLAAMIRSMDDTVLEKFLAVLAGEFACDPKEVENAVAAWQAQPGDKTLAALRAALEAPRQELFRRINTAQGTRTLVRFRERLLGLGGKRQELRGIDEDLRHLLASWFNRGFLRLERIDWNTPAALLEKLIQYEAVHQIDGWDDLRLRLAADRRCFAFFHPAMPDEPLIFVEVALVSGMPDAIAPLLDQQRAIGDAQVADTAVFYSISNCQDGLRGISFGNFLIKQVVGELSAEFPNLKTFVTLSPVPRLREALKRRDPSGFSLERLERVLGEEALQALDGDGLDDPIEALERRVASDEALSPLLTRALHRLALAYLTQQRQSGRAFDPVAHFHLSNGARLERIDLGADRSAKGLAESLGVMVNYLYEPKSLEANHERYVDTGVVPVSRKLAAEADEAAKQWEVSEAA